MLLQGSSLCYWVALLIFSDFLVVSSLTGVRIVGVLTKSQLTFCCSFEYRKHLADSWGNKILTM